VLLCVCMLCVFCVRLLAVCAGVCCVLRWLCAVCFVCSVVWCLVSAIVWCGYALCARCGVCSAVSATTRRAWHTHIAQHHNRRRGGEREREESKRIDRLAGPCRLGAWTPPTSHTNTQHTKRTMDMYIVPWGVGTKADVPL
jgi:hypothetical protein